MESINFISNGRTGDLIHNLFAVKSICEKNNSKANLYITNDLKYGGDKFLYSIEKTYDDLKDIILYQKYINKFEILSTNTFNFVNLNSWRTSPLFSRTNWFEILMDLYKIPPPKNSWMEIEKKELDLVLIHRSDRRHTITFPWLDIINKNKCKFVTTDLNEYENFYLKDKVELLLCKNFYDMVVAINSCKIFVGNMSTPLAIAHALGVPHFAELYRVDQVHYIGEEKHIGNYFYIKDGGHKSTDGLENFLTL